MGYTFAEKALARAAGMDHAVAGQIVDARPDIVLSHDNTAAIARTFRELGAGRVLHPERLAITLDHAVPAPTTQHATNHAEVRRFVAEQGITHFFEAGRGICHQVLSEEALVWPGQLVLGADSHTTHLGWLGAFAAGIGRSEVAALWATGELWLRVPETIRVDLVGTLPPWVTPKDLSLWLLRLLGPEAAVYAAVEFGGPGLTGLSISGRMVLPNMLAEAGVKSAYLPPDNAVFDWLAPRAARWTGLTVTTVRARLAAGALYPDPDAVYSAHHTLDLGTLEPMIACPHRPDNVVPLGSAAGTHVDQAFIGTCTNGRLEDLAAAAAILREPGGQVRRVAPGTRLLVIPASSQVLGEALAAGYIETFVAAGAMIGTPGCGPCMGNHMGIPAPGEVTISSANRNFRGRMGTPESSVYLASPAVVAASAIAGRIVDPREVVGEQLRVDSSPLPVVTEPPSRAGDHASTGNARPPAPDGSTEAVATAATATAAITRSSPGLASSTPAQDFEYKIPNIMGRCWKYGDDVNTDVIFPGKYTYTITDRAEMARHALEDLDPVFAGAVRASDIIVAGRNWGCGSSREQAVTCLATAGVRAIVAASFARIYFRNAVNSGLLPVACPEAAAAIQPGETITIDLQRCTVHCAAGEFAFPPLSPSLYRIIEAGGLVPMLRAAYQAI
jgi:3-isopropylmalate/(R)-2-methylmalate dehydratase large subunit